MQKHANGPMVIGWVLLSLEGGEVACSNLGGCPIFVFLIIFSRHAKV
jgi:hypothetical protein